MIRTHKIRLNPTPEQEIYLRKAAGTARFVFNWGLTRWKEAKAQGLTEYGIAALDKELNAIKRQRFPWMYEVSKSVAQVALKNLGKALANYFDSKNGKRKGEKMGFPHFKSRKRANRSFGLQNSQFSVEGYTIRIPHLGWVNMACPLRFAGKVMGATLSESGTHWYVAIQVETEKPEPVNHPALSVGIDLGVKTLATLSDGAQFENQKLLRRDLNKLRKLSRSLSRRKEQSHRWYKAKARLARFHQRVKNQRSDVIHKMTTQIAKTYAFIGVEDLNLKGMVRNRKLALSIADASMGEVLRQLTYKADLYGSRVVKVGRFYASSKTCNDCGHIHKELQLSDRTWACQGCGVVHDRDWNAAVNIEQEALRLVA